MKRAHALVISALVAAAVFLGVGTAFEATKPPPEHQALSAKTNIDATVARETRRLNRIQRQLDKALRDNPPPAPKAPVVRYVTSGGGSQQGSSTGGTTAGTSGGTSYHEDDHGDDGHEAEHESREHEDGGEGDD